MAKAYGHAGQEFDDVLDHLNTIWNLQIPRSPKGSFPDARDSAKALAVHCSFRIRYLCQFSENVLDKSVADFEDEAKHIFSKWVWKPSQEMGTLPSVSPSNSILQRDIQSSKHRFVSPELRYGLLQRLSSILDDEFALAKDSKHYERVSSPPSSAVASRSTSFTTAASDLQRNFGRQRASQSDTQQLSGQVTPNKRRNASGDAQEGKRSRVGSRHNTNPRPNVPLKDLFRRTTKSSHSLSLPDAKTQASATETVLDLEGPSQAGTYHSQDVVTSFDSAMSPVQSVFSSFQEQTSYSSANTSLIFEECGSQDYFPTQDARDCLEVESFISALDNPSDTISSNEDLASLFSFDNLGAGSPFKRSHSLPSNLVYWARWEIYRIAQHTDIAPAILCSALADYLGSECLRYEVMWKTLGTLCKRHGKTLPSRSDIRSWMEESGMYEAPDGTTAYFTFNLEYNYAPGPHLWKFILNPIKVDKGNRIHRRFGADRHLMGFLNYFDKSSLPKWITQRSDFDADQAFQKIGRWIATEMHHIAGREWRAFYLEPEKTKTKRREGEMPRQKLSLFCVDGVDFVHSVPRSVLKHTAIPIIDFVNWHIPLQQNLHSTNLKLFSRFGLGLSKTKSTIAIRPDQFRHLPDIEPVMNDGCALMSMTMATEIWNICGDGSNDIPSAFQGRLSGGKGLWIIDYRSSSAIDTEEPWIQVSDSQLKIWPHPRDRLDADETQRSFEVLKWSSPCEPGHLNMQLINILADRGVPRATLRQIVLNDIEEYIEVSKAAMRDARQLQAWLQDFHRIDRHQRLVDFDDGLPEMKEEEACFLVESGFDAEDCEHLRRDIISLMTQRLNMYVEKLRIEVPHSTTVFCVPDPYQVLEEDEVYLGFSRPWENPRTGFKEPALYDLDVLVARNPAALASDIQKRRAVYRQELRHFKDVIVFPTKGSAPLASLLSGGDYDGDTVTVLWDPELVDHFENVEKPELPTEEQCGLQKASIKLTDIVKDSTPSERELDEFLTSCILFNARPSRLGVCTNEHERLIYSGAKLSDPGSVLLAALAGYLVDANKQGLAQSESAWFRLRKTAQGGRKLLPLAYKSGQDLPRKWDNECINIIDHLKFDVAMKRKENVLVEFESMLPNAKNYDRILSVPYADQHKRSIDRSDPDSLHVASMLDHLKASLKTVVDEWQRRSGKRQQNTESSRFTSDVRHISSMIHEIKPIVCDCDIYWDYLRDAKDAVNTNNPLLKGSRWSLLRASAMYKWYNKNRITWWSVGDELCRIKARSMGPTRELVPQRHHVLKADSKYIKRWVAQNSGQDDEEIDD